MRRKVSPAVSRFVLWSRASPTIPYFRFLIAWLALPTGFLFKARRRCDTDIFPTSNTPQKLHTKWPKDSEQAAPRRTTKHSPRECLGPSRRRVTRDCPQSCSRWRNSQRRPEKRWKLRRVGKPSTCAFTLPILRHVLQNPPTRTREPQQKVRLLFQSRFPKALLPTPVTTPLSPHHLPLPWTTTSQPQRS